MRDALKRLLDAFDGIGEAHGEVEDTMVREMTNGVVYTHFVMAKPDAEMADYFGMFTDEGNAAVGAAISAFLQDPEVIAVRDASTPQQRLDAFQDISVVSDSGMTYDEYFGYIDALP